MALLKLVSHNLNINFIGFRLIAFSIAIIISIGTLSTIMVKGINYGIDFEGGYIIEVRMAEKPDIPILRDRINQLDIGDASIQTFGTENDLLVRVEKKAQDSLSEEAAQEQAITSIKSVLGENNDYRRIETVGPKVGEELVKSSLKAVCLALFAMLIYIAVRFEWQFAVCAIVALAHDTIAILGIFSVLPFEFNETAIIAILITAGYSINDTIVIFDRIRESMRKYRKMELGELINRSINETLSRTVLTATTTLIALLALYIWGGKVISAFSIPIIIGIFVGSFSSICLAAPLLLYLNIKNKGDAPKEITTG